VGPLENLRQLAGRMFDTLGAPEAPQNLLARPGELVTVVWIAALALWILASVRQGRALRAAGVLPVGSAPSAQGAAKVPGGRWWRRPIVVSGSSYTAWALVFVELAWLVLPQHLIRPIWLWGVNFRLIEVICVLAVAAVPVRLRPEVRPGRWQAWTGLLLMLVCTVAFAACTAGAFVRARADAPLPEP
jgi:hypothetical protein